ncbi:hypothetical protein BDV26DRAFT_293967 [Aspergillus bertholletiae]|uniref:Uncharacterized protein n=1 Tax=Aspergillus bertholletiae TaxID=1226010 RepID=A0A5N7B5Q5_9EURO|nr:hypothetical protein BDV26DRAFT_293967 [Aspergillus bertholletiae]
MPLLSDRQKWVTTPLLLKGILAYVPPGCKSTDENWYHILRRMGLEQKFQSKSICEQGMEIIDHVGKTASRNGKITSMSSFLMVADGQGSRIHKMTIGFELDPFHPLGIRIGYFAITSGVEPGKESNTAIYIVPRGWFVFTRRHSPYAI